MQDENVTASQFTPESDELPPMSDLETLSVVSDDDVESATKKWRDNPPDNEYEAILDADEVEGDG